jgi:hypothetical protein
LSPRPLSSCHGALLNVIQIALHMCRGARGGPTSADIDRKNRIQSRAIELNYFRR